MSNATRAIPIVKAFWTPILERAGFVGAFPAWHRLGKQCVECVAVSVSVRAGVDVHLGALPLRRLLATSTPMQDRSRYLTSPLPSHTLRQDVSVRVFIWTPAQWRALPSRLPQQARAFAREAKAYWAGYSDFVAWRKLTEEIGGALALGRRATLATCFRRHSRALIERALAVVQLRAWWQAPRLPPVYRCAPLLVRYRPTMLVGGMLVAQAARVLVKHPRDKQARAIFAWVRPHLRTVEHLAGQIALMGDYASTERAGAAASLLYELLIDSHRLEVPQYGNAVWSLLRDNGTALDDKRARRVLAVALAKAGDDASVRFNAACFEAEAGDDEAAVRHLVAALGAGASHDHAQKEKLLRRIVADPRVQKAMGKKPTGAKRGPSRLRSHATPALR